MSNLDDFMTVYEVYLREEIKRHPNLYAYSEADIPDVLARMRTAVLHGSMNISSAMKRACKSLGIKATYAGIREFVNGT